MIRKQVYLGAEQQEKLRRIARRKGCTESELLREAIDRLPEEADPVVMRLAAAGLLSRPPATGRQPSAEEVERMRTNYLQRVSRLGKPLRLSEAVLEDRE